MQMLTKLFGFVIDRIGLYSLAFSVSTVLHDVRVPQKIIKRHRSVRHGRTTAQVILDGTNSQSK